MSALDRSIIDNEQNFSPKEISQANHNCITGDTVHLYSRIKEAFERAISIDIIVSFLMESGVKLLAQDLELANERNIPIRILTGNYLNITQPQALYLLKDTLGNKLDLRFYNVKNKSFHPKAYIFHYKHDGEIYLGSSNMSYSALTSGIEWNYRITRSKESEDFNCFMETFEELFINKSTIIDDKVLRSYADSWIRPKIYKDIEKSQEESEEECSNVFNLYEPRGAQIEILHHLKETREEGFDKGLVVAATGLGKTYLSAFDSKDFNKILFVAHREEILKQAERAFHNVRPEKKTGFFIGSNKDKEVDILFASVFSLGKEEYLDDRYFTPQDFDYIIIDEFHHASARSYSSILEYFKPKFLLGLTATPERMDNKNILSLCDYNLVYEIRLREAINRGVLCPFRYYGIYDDSVDYNEIEIKNGKYQEEKLEKALMIHKRSELIVNHYNKYRSERAIGFCSSISHANYMAEAFSDKGIPCASVHSGESNSFTLEREEALLKLERGEIKIIFSVDVFNEGLDIPSIDMVMFLRPTESRTIFLQQLGRGLRLSKGKDYLNVLDFIGNYKKANLIPFLLTGAMEKATSPRAVVDILKKEDYPMDCFVDFDFRLVDIFKAQEERSLGIQEIINREYLRVKELLHKVPTRVELFTNMDEQIFLNIKSKSKFNMFRDYLSFLKEMGDLTKEEEAFINTPGADFIRMVETTSMSKTYKMPVFLAFYNKGNMKASIADEDIYESFKAFYEKGSNGIDLMNQKSTSNYKNWGSKEYVHLAKANPIKYLLITHGDYFYESGDTFNISSEVSSYITNESFLRHFKDAIDYRTQEYYRIRYENKLKEMGKE